jgi:hypothetical protein
MGDRRFDDPLKEIASAPDRAAAIASLSFEELLQALAAASRKGEPLLANVLATAALNRYRKRAALATALIVGALAAFGLALSVVIAAGVHPNNLPES